MPEPKWLHLTPVNEVAEMPHQPSRQCWCGPSFAIDIRSTFGRDDIRILLHRSKANPEVDEFVGLHARKGEFIEIP